MNTPRFRRLASGNTLPLFCVLLFWLGAFSISCKVGGATATSNSGSSLSRAVLGESRKAFGGEFAVVADRYFHGGVPPSHDEAFDNRFFQKLHHELAPRGHFHLERNVTTETLPWYWMAIKMDPHNIDNYLVTAFTLSTRVKRPDIAHEVLQEARRNNPLNYEVELEDACIYLREKKLKEAATFFDYGLKLWPSNEDPSSESARIGKIQLLMHRALLYEAEREIDSALSCLRQIQELQPEDTDLQKRIKTLAEGRQPSEVALVLLEALLAPQEKGDCHYSDPSATEHAHSSECNH